MFGAKETMVLQVEGMHCVHCQAKAVEALKAVKGVKKVAVDLEQKTATVTVKAGKVTAEMLCTALAQVGFEGKA